MTSTPTPESLSRRMRVLKAFLGGFDRIAPRRQDVIAAMVGAGIGFVPLAVFRLVIALDEYAQAGLTDLVRVEYAEIETWAWIGLAGLFFLRFFSERQHRKARFLFHGFCTTLLLLAGGELAFLQVTGTRIDPDILGYLAEATKDALPIAMAQFRAWHAVALIGAFILGLLPALPRLRPGVSPWPGRIAPLLMLALLVFVPAPPSALHTEPNVQSTDANAPKPNKLRHVVPSLSRVLLNYLLNRAEDVLGPPPAPVPPIVLSAPEQRPNIVIVLMESTGASVTSMANPSLPSTPNLARLASKGISVSNTFNVMPHSSKAIMGVLCSQFPELTRTVWEARWGGLPFRCGPELFKEMGYKTAFFQTARQSFERRYSLTHEMKFDRFRGQEHHERAPFETVNYLGIEDKAMLEPSLAWAQEAGEPFFITYMTVTTHEAYDTPRNFAKKKFSGKGKRQQRYLNALRYVDEFVGELVQGYEDLGLAENTLFVILGDHGEAFGQHGRYYHDLVIYDEALHVPLVLYGPKVLGGQTGTIDGYRTNMDILPTLLELMGVSLLSGSMEGSSLFAPPPERSLYHSCWRAYRCLAYRDQETKFIDHYRERPPQIFDLAKDPGELMDFAPETHESDLDRHREHLRDWRAGVNANYLARRDEFRASLITDDPSPAIATWGDEMELIHCSAEKEIVEPADAVWVHCRWRLKNEHFFGWKMHAQIHGDWDGYGASDETTIPADELLPTSQWPEGKAVDDRFAVFIPASAPPGDVTVEVGWKGFFGQAVPLGENGELYPAVRVKVIAPQAMVPVRNP